MKIPFADLFRRSKAKLKPAPPQPRIAAPMPTAKKSEGERLAKTVMPSTARAVISEIDSASDTADETVRAALASAGPETGTAAATAPPFATETARPVAGPPKISMGGSPTVAVQSLPPAVAVALAPDVERAISLPLEDVIAQIPEGYLKPRASFDAQRAVLLKAAEVEKGMATGRPAIAVQTLFQQAPDIFMRTVSSTDAAMIGLPFERVMNALSNLAVRSDQAAEQGVPQVETPFLQVTREDTERFGTPMPSMPAPSATVETEERQPVRIELPTAEAYAAAVPEPSDTFVPRVDPESIGAKRIPFNPAAEPAEAEEAEKFGTGEPAFPRVPASSGPPVPLVPPAPAASARANIPFSFPAPSDEAKKHLQKDEGGRMKDEGGKQRTEGEGQRSEVRGPGSEVGGSYNEPVLTLPLRPILQHLPPLQLGGNPATVPETTTVSFPMSMIAPQLATGKVAVTPNAFYAALPEECRKLFLPNTTDVRVQLPLADVLGNLPEKILSRRGDQEVHTQDETFETPFSAKAAEDAARFAEGGGRKVEGGRKNDKTPAQQEASSKFDAREAVAKASALSGVASCGVSFADGLGIAGNIPESMHVDGLSAVAPTLLQKLDKHMLETSLGPLQCLTVHGESAPVSFFTAGNVCLTALHSGEGLGAETRRQLVRMTEEISRAYPQSGPSEQNRA